MSTENELRRVHPKGEVENGATVLESTATSLDTFAGKVYVRWAPGAAVSGLGLMPYFIEFLKTSGLFDKWVEDCPLHYTSGNAPEKRNILGTLLLSVVNGQRRYAHINAIRGDGVNPGLLGMSKVASEDSIRNGMKSMEEAASGRWMKEHLKASYEPLLQEPWILDVDTTVKPLYGHQQEAVVGYNPAKPGRPSHAYHSYFVANIRMVLDMEVQPGNQTAPSFAQPELWSFLDGVAERDRPIFLRGDSHWGAEKAMVGAAEHSLPVQTQAERECEEADRANLHEAGVGGCWARMARQRRCTAVERMEQAAAGGGAAAAIAEQTGRGNSDGWQEEVQIQSGQTTNLGSAGTDLQGDSI